TFSQKKAAVERDYAQYLKREWPDSLSEEPTDHRNMYTLWKAYLEGTVQVSQTRITACENYRNQVTDPAKTARLQKEQQLRKEEVPGDRDHGPGRQGQGRAGCQLKAKRSECNSKATHARNDYLLTLAAANAHQQRYYNTDLINCVKVLDGDIYEQVKDYLVSLCQMELESYQAVHNTFNILLESSNGVMQDFHQQQFVQQNPVRQLQKESGTAEEHSLDKEARKWATRVAREHKSIIHSQRALEEYGTQQGLPEQNHSELELKMEEARENLRRAETVKLKADARLALLRDAGITVETWLKSAMNQVMEELENERWANLNANDPSLTEDEELEDSGEVLDDSSSSPSSTLRNYPLTCKVLYSYKASQPDELTIEEQDLLEVIDDGDMEDWVKTGQVGYVPEKYLQLPSSNSLMSMLQSLAALDARSHSSSNSTEPELAESELPTPGTPSVNGDSSSVCFAKALYDYAGQTDEELSFPEGAVIRVLSRETHEDDGFWEGEFNGTVGVFPAVLVEDLLASGGAALSIWAHSTAAPSSPSSASASPIPRPPSINGHHRAPPAPLKGHLQSPAQSSTQPPRYPTDGGAGGTIRPVRAAPPPPKPQQPHGQWRSRWCNDAALGAVAAPHNQIRPDLVDPGPRPTDPPLSLREGQETPEPLNQPAQPGGIPTPHQRGSMRGPEIWNADWVAVQDGMHRKVIRSCAVRHTRVRPCVRPWVRRAFKFPEENHLSS
ncbi:unnamed protein product, partial [Coregonus sp. 'balchen']